MDNFVIDTNSIPSEEDLQLEGYDSYLMIFTKDGRANYKYGHKPDCEKQLSIILNHIRYSAMFRDLAKLLPASLDKGAEIVEDADAIQKNNSDTQLNVPVVHPLQFHSLGVE